MSEETCGGRVVKVWEVASARYFLRDDRDAGICDYERYSLFRAGEHYGRVIILSMSLEDALNEVPQRIKEDLHSLNGSKQ